MFWLNCMALIVKVESVGIVPTKKGLHCLRGVFPAEETARQYANFELAKRRSSGCHTFDRHGSPPGQWTDVCHAGELAEPHEECPGSVRKRSAWRISLRPAAETVDPQGQPFMQIR